MQRGQECPRYTFYFLPDAAAIFADHGLACFALEGFAKFGHVGDYAIGAIFFR